MMTYRRNWPSGSFRIGIFWADTVLAAQLVGAVAIGLWLSGYQDDWVGFLMLGGGIASILAFLVFVPYSLLYLWKAPGKFWLSFHPLNAGLALVAISAAWAWRDGWPSVFSALCYCVGIIAGLGGGFFLRRYPAAFIALALLLTTATRWIFPWHISVKLAGGAGMLLLVLCLQRRLLRKF